MVINARHTVVAHELAYSLENRTLRMDVFLRSILQNCPRSYSLGDMCVDANDV